MAQNNFYWLKLKKDFFKRHDIKIIEAMPNGKDYILFYLKLLVESVDHVGNLRFSETIPYDEGMLSIITNTNIDITRSAMEIFIRLKMIEVLNDKTIYMSEVEKMVGSETYWAEKKRLQRSKRPLKIGQCPNNVLDVSKMSNVELDIELDIEKERDIPEEIPFSEESNEMKLSKYLFGYILKSDPKKKEPNYQKWSKAFDLILRIDKRELEEVKKIIRYCQADSFWQGNILSPTKLRDKYTQLLIQMNGHKKTKQQEQEVEHRYDDEFYENILPKR